MQKSRVKSDEYEFKQAIGKGTFGVVEKCICRKDGKVYAVKVISVNALDVESIKEEAITMLALESNYVLELKDQFYDELLSSYILVTPYYKLGSFDSLMGKPLTLDWGMLFLFQISKAFELMLQMSVYHFDLKPENILIKAPGEYVVCDFGCARSLEAGNMSYNQMRMSTSVKGGGTLEYGSPELILNTEMSSTNDIFSMGIILYKLIYKVHPLASALHYTTILADFNQGKVRIKYPNVPELLPLIDLVKEMLLPTSMKSKRIQWREVINRIYRIALKERAGDHPIIVTNVKYLLSYGYNIQLLLSGLIHYIELNLESLAEANPNDVINLSCNYILMICREIAGVIRDKTNEFTAFYLFDTTRAVITEQQRSTASQLQEQAAQFMIEQNVQPCGIKSNEMLKQLLQKCKQFHAQYKQLPKKTRPVLKQWLKIGKILSFLEKNKLEYDEFPKLSRFCDYLIKA